MLQKHCGGCHRILTRTQGGQGVGNTGPNLSGLFSEFYPGVFRGGERWAATNLKKWVVNPREIRRQALMPPLTLADAEWEQVLKAFDAEGLGAGPAHDN